MKSKHLTFFKQLRDLRPNFYQLYGSRILVEVLPDPEIRTANGLILTTTPKSQRTDTEENKFTAAVILSVGAGYYDEDKGEDVPLTLKPGQVVEVVRSGLRRYSTHPALGQQYSTGDLATTKEGDVIGLLAESVEEYAATFETIAKLQQQ